MHKLSPLPGKNIQLEIVPGQHTEFRKPTVEQHLAARNAGAEELSKGGPHAMARAQAAFTRAFAALGIVGWEGVADADGVPVDPTPENIAAYLADWRVFEAVDRLYVAPALQRLDEKNASSPSRNGTGAEEIQGRTIADTVRKPARSAPTN